GMLKDLAKRLQVDLKKVPYIGDSLADVQAARAAGCQPILVRSGNGRDTEKANKRELAGVAIYDDLAAAATALIAA
ncbi:MAG TPA: HAD hydrolase-like protein, partial [Nevskiaceae bacterium]|nr:HAD hydrolase-like protein [Nevskiaceae bacterium]